MIEEEFHVVVHCPRCGVPAEAWLSEVPSADLAADSVHDSEETEAYDFDCENCGHTFSVTIRAHLAGWDVFLTDEPSTQGTFEHYNYDDWIDEVEPEPHPYANFNENIKEWVTLHETIGDKDTENSAVNRMLLVQLFSIVEAYLADAIVKLVYGDPDITATIIQWHPDLKNMQVSLPRVATEPNLARDIVIAQLRKTQFHRFAFVNGLLRESLKHNLLPVEKASRDIVLKSVQLRHACVHRNGRDENGASLDGLTSAYLKEIAGYFTDIVAALAAKIEEVEI